MRASRKSSIVSEMRLRRERRAAAALRAADARRRRRAAAERRSATAVAPAGIGRCAYLCCAVNERRTTTVGLIGRDDAVGVLEALLDGAASAGGARCAVVSAPAGGGKTALVSTFADRVDADSLVITADIAEQSLDYAVADQLLRAAGDARPDRRSARRSAGGRGGRVAVARAGASGSGASGRRWW